MDDINDGFASQPPAATPIDIVPLAQPIAIDPQQVQELQYAGYSSGAAAIWREGRILAFRPGTPLPTQRCIKCNAPSDGRPIRRKLAWHSPLLYLLLLLICVLSLIGLLIFAAVAIFMTKREVTHVGLCQKHRSRRRRFLAAAWIMCLSIVPFFAAAITVAEGALLATIGIVVFLAGLVLYLFGGQIITPTRIEDDVVRVSGAGDAFLDAFGA